MKKIILILALLLFSINIFSNSITAEGYGRTKKIAEKEALIELKKEIQNELAKYLKKKKETDKNLISWWQSDQESFDKLYNDVISSKVKIILLDTKYESFKDGGEFISDAVFSSSSKSIYEEKLIESKENIEKAIEALKKIDNDLGRKAAIKAIFISIDKFNNLKLLSYYLGVTGNNYDLDLSKKEIENIDQKTSVIFKTLEDGAVELAKEISEEDIFVYPLISSKSSGITDFSTMFKNLFEKKIKSVSDPANAKYSLLGDYTVLENKLQINYKLSDSNNKIIKTVSVDLAEDAYKNIIGATTPTVRNGIEVFLKTDLGRENIKYKDGDFVEFFIKINKEAYFYIIVHSLKVGENFSYLLDIGDSNKGKEQFIGKISKNEAGKWVKLARFKASAPYGVENIQVVAFTKKDTSLVPDSYKNDSNNLNIVVDGPHKVLKFIRKIISDKKEEIAEDTISITTSEK